MSFIAQWYLKIKIPTKIINFHQTEERKTGLSMKIHHFINLLLCELPIFIAISPKTCQYWHVLGVTAWLIE